MNQSNPVNNSPVVLGHPLPDTKLPYHRLEDLVRYLWEESGGSNQLNLVEIYQLVFGNE